MALNTDEPDNGNDSSGPLKGRRPRVLVIDDEVLLGQTLQLGLDETMDVILEVRGKQGLERLLSDEAFDLVFCDIGMPEVSGVEIVERLNVERPERLPSLIIMTGGAVTDEARQFLSGYTGAILQKPFRLRDVELMAAQLLERSRR